MYFLTVIIAGLLLQEGDFLSFSRRNKQIGFPSSIISDDSSEENKQGSPSSCFFLNSSPGYCIPLTQCNKLKVLTYDDSPDNLSILRRATCGYTDRVPLMCCPIADTNLVTDSSPTNSNFIAATRLPLEKRLPSICGRSTASYTRIVDGEPAKQGAWPWMVLLGYRNSIGTVDYLCGGTLITNRHILTAAHCVFAKDDLSLVRLGEHDVKSEDDGANPIDIDIAIKTIHHDYDGRSRSMENDIAVLTLKSSVPFSDFISPICLPVAQEHRKEIYTGLNPFIAGWGHTDFGSQASSLLLQTQVLVTSPDHCVQAFSNFSVVVVDQRVVCAGARNGREDSCQGDSGGPLMLPKGDEFYQIGIVSFGIKCGVKQYPGIYTRTGAFVDWIVEQLV